MSEPAIGDTAAAAYGPARTIISSIYEFSPTALEELVQWIEQRGLRIPASQMIGPQRYQEIGYVETTSPVVIPSGGSGTILTLTVPVGSQSQIAVTAAFPAFNFTATSGGDATVALNVGSPPTAYTIGRLTSDRQLAWPVSLTRRAPIGATGNVTIALLINSITGAVTAQAGGTYGAISLLVSAK